ncbi:MAG: Fic family protein [Eubacteriales bacterium]
MKQDPFKEYLIQTEPNKRDKGYVWHTAIGLQAVDGLKPSKYLVDTAIQNIEGEISFEEAQQLLDTYYKENPKVDEWERTEEADKVSLRIAKLLSEKAFSFTPMEYIAIHKKLFNGIYEHAGKIRDYNITKKEWVLDGDTILYGSASELRATLDYDFLQERSFNYKGLSMDEIIHHLARFVSGLWQIHIFSEGNTRTTAVFFIKYIRTLGFQATNDIFAENAWYFRNALVRANYNNLVKKTYETTEFLELFLRNLLCDEQHELYNRAMHVSDIYKDYKKINLESKNANIEAEKTSIDILQIYGEQTKGFTLKRVEYIQLMFDEFGIEDVFGRTDVQRIIPLGNTRASALLKKLLEVKVIESVSGQGKGKYRFCRL